MGEQEKNTSAIKIRYTTWSIYLCCPALPCPAFFVFPFFPLFLCDVDRYIYIPMKKNERTISFRCRSKLEWKNGDGRMSLTHVLISISIYIYHPKYHKLLKRTY